MRRSLEYPMRVDNLSHSLSVSTLDIKVLTNSPVLLGDTLVLNATVWDGDEEPTKGNYCYTWTFRNLSWVGQWLYVLHCKSLILISPNQLFQTYEDTSPYSTWKIPMNATFHKGSFVGTLDVAKTILGLCPPFPKTKRFHIKVTGTLLCVNTESLLVNSPVRLLRHYFRESSDQTKQ